MYASRLFAEDELWSHAAEIEEMKAPIWQESIPLRPDLPLTIRRVKNYTSTGTTKDTFTTELECLSKTLTVAPCQNASNAAFLLKGWFKILDPILGKYELLDHPPMKPSTSNSPDTFIRSIITSVKYQEKYKEKS